jgi:ADP-ribose pyrophosphatase
VFRERNGLCRSEVPVFDASWQHRPEADQTLEQNWLFTLLRRRYVSRHSQRAHDYYVVRLADAVHGVALTPDERMVLVRQFRAGSGRDSLETAGGLLNPGEDPCAAGARELLEETGYAGDSPVLLGTCWANPSLLTSRISTVLIRNARRVAEPKPDVEEEVHVELVPAGHVPQMIRDGRIDHALVVEGLLLWLVSQLPDSPWAPPFGQRERNRNYPPLPRQFRLWMGLALVAVCALAFALVRVLGAQGSIIFGLLVVTALLPWLHAVLWDPWRSAILLRGKQTILRRVVQSQSLVMWILITSGFLTFLLLLLSGRMFR